MGKKDTSAQEPSVYQARFTRFMDKILEEEPGERINQTEYSRKMISNYHTK